MRVEIPNTITATIGGLISRGVKAVEVTDGGRLVFTLTDGSTVDVGSVVGPQGEKGGTAVGFSPEETIFTRQEHTDLLLRVGKKDCGTGLEREQTAVCDGLLTDEPGAALVCFGADCTTLLLFDPVRQAIAAVHAGWRGTAQGIAYKAVLRMQAEFGCAPEHIHAAIGPCIGRCCFEVGPEVPEAMRRSLGPDAEAAIELHGEKAHVDLKRLNRIWLEKAGVRAIDICPDCTKCQPERFWSHRVTGGNRGSQAAIIRLKGGAPA